MGAPLFSLVMNYTSAKDCWKALELNLSPRKMINTQGIHDDLRNLKKLDTETMNEYLIKVRTLSDALKMSGEVVRDIDLIDYAADGIGTEYRPFISSVHTHLYIHMNSSIY